MSPEVVRKIKSGGAVHFPRQVIDLFTGAIQLHNDYRAGRVAAAVLECARDDYEERLWRLLSVERAVPAYATLSSHLERHFESWFTFLTNPALPATNAIFPRSCFSRT